MAMDPVITLIKDDPDLMHRLMDAGTREERAAILADYGVEVPDPEQLKAKMTELMAVSGGQGAVTTTAAAVVAAAFL